MNRALSCPHITSLFGLKVGWAYMIQGVGLHDTGGADLGASQHVG